MDKDFLSSLTAESAARMKKRALTGARKICNPATCKSEYSEKCSLVKKAGRETGKVKRISAKGVIEKCPLMEYNVPADYRSFGEKIQAGVAFNNWITMPELNALCGCCEHCSKEIQNGDLITEAKDFMKSCMFCPVTGARDNLQEAQAEMGL